MASFAAGKRIIFAYKVALSKDHKLGEMGGAYSHFFRALDRIRKWIFASAMEEILID